MDDKLILEIELVVLGRELSLKTGVHWHAKKALKWFAFSLKFDISLLLFLNYVLRDLNHVIKRKFCATRFTIWNLSSTH